MEDDFWWKYTFDGRLLLMEEDFWWKTTFNGRRLLREDDYWWKTNFDGRQLLRGNNFWCKTTFNGRQSSMVDDFQCKSTFGGKNGASEGFLNWSLTLKTKSIECDIKRDSLTLDWSHSTHFITYWAKHEIKKICLRISYKKEKWSCHLVPKQSFHLFLN